MQKNIIFTIDPEIVLNENQKISPTSLPLKKASPQFTVDTQNAGNSGESMSNFKTPLQTDPWIYRIIVSALAATIISSITGAVWLAANDKKNIPDLLIALGTGSLGALAGLLAPTPPKE